MLASNLSRSPTACATGRCSHLLLQAVLCIQDIRVASCDCSMRTPQPDVRVVPHSAVLRICDVRVARVHATCSSGCLRVNLLRPHRRQSMHVLRDGHGSASALHPGHMPHGHVCACDGQGTLCASHPELMLCVHVCASRRTRHCVCFASGTRAERALGGKRKRLCVRAVCAKSAHHPLSACSLFLL